LVVCFLIFATGGGAMRFNFWHGLVILYLIARAVMAAADDHAVALPPGVQAVWDLDKAHRETTPTREQICINGLWRWQPAAAQPDQPPDKNWGHFKVPGCWPGITNYMQKDSQTVFAHPSWQDQRLSGVTAAWYEREIAIPAAWTGRRITLSADCVDSLAIAYVDGRRAGELRFPGGELDLTPVLMPSEKHCHALLQRQQCRPSGAGQRRPPRPVRRCVPRQ
jgi:beta-galactosidase